MIREESLQPRDQLLRDTFTPAETALCITLLTIGSASFWIGTPRSNWLLGALVIVACLTPMILKLHERTHPFFIDRLWTKFWLVTAPAWCVALIQVLGLPQNPLRPVVVDDSALLTLREVNPFWPVTTGGAATALSTGAHVAILLIASMVFFIPKSRAFFERVLPWLCLSAASVAVFGYLQIAFGLDAPLWTKGTGRPDFFAFFPYDGHWAAFATLWSGACFALAMLVTRYQDGSAFIDSPGPFYLAGGLLLGASGLILEAHWPAILLLANTSLLLLLFARSALRKKEDPHRSLITSLATAGSLAFLIATTHRLIQGAPSSPASALLQEGAWRLFEERPLFGSGVDSFPQLLPFYASDQLHGLPYARAASDLPVLLAECGLAGLGAFGLLFTLLMLRYLRGHRVIQLTHHLLIGIASLLLLALVDTPFMSPSVLLSFFILFFTALRWADLTRSEADRVDAIRPKITGLGQNGKSTRPRDNTP